MKNHTDLMQDWRDCCADLQAAEQALPPLAEVETALRATLENATESWRRFVSRLAGEFAAGDGRSTLRHLAGGVDIAPDLALAAAIDAHGVDRLLKNARDEAARVQPQAVRLAAADRAEALALLSRQRFELEAQLATLHFAQGEPLPDGINPAALLGLPVDVAEAAGLLTWSA